MANITPWFASLNVSMKNTQVDKNKSVSQWNAWPATGHSAVQDLRSCAILQASLAFSRVSSSICCTHVRQGRPRWHFHSGLMSGLPAVRASTGRRSVEWAGVASGSRRRWPKMESRLRQIRIAKPSSPVWLVTEAFVTKWNQQIPKIRRWQFMWNASNRCSSAFRRVHVSEPYNSTEMTRVDKNAWRQLVKRLLLSKCSTGYIVKINRSNAWRQNKLALVTINNSLASAYAS